MGLFRKRLADGERLDLGDIAVRLKVNGRARRVSLRVDPISGEAVATAPSVSRLVDAAEFARARRGWLAERLAARPAPRRFAAGDAVPLLGETVTLRPDGRRTRRVGGEIVGCGAGEVDAQLVVRAVTREALAAFEAAAARHCTALGVPRPRLRLGDARGRWGSCTAARAGRPASIRLSWRLALAPAAVADYVVAHECAHLLEANHGPRFWSHVHALVGDHRAHRAWLRAHGAALHAFGR